MLSSLEHTFFIAAIVILSIELCISACARAEYEINGECCPMCSPGNRVYRHCTEFTSTTCIQCVDSTYTDEPNGLPKCISCTVCDAAQGLRIKTACTRMSDTVCEPLEGFYCIDAYRSSCRYAVEHTKCSPGQYIKEKGTAVNDAECAVCADGTYSNGSLHMCKQYTKCEDLGLQEISPGTSSSDAECGEKTPVALIVGISVVVPMAVVGVALAFFIRRKKGPCTSSADKKIKQRDEGDTLPPLMRTDRMDVGGSNRPGHVSSPVETFLVCSTQKDELTHTDGVT